MTHIMLDLETWGKRPGCDIRSIGAVVFNPVAGTVHNELGDYQFYLATDNPAGRMRYGVFVPSLATGDEDYLKYPLTRDPETVEWWSKQTPEAQAAFANPVDLREACLRFGDWVNNSFMNANDYLDDYWQPSTVVRIWANDPHFDCSILAEVYHAVGLPVPWHYRSPRSMKTIAEAAGMTSDDFASYGVDHNALDDAIAQAMTVCEAYKRLGLQK